MRCARLCPGVRVKRIETTPVPCRWRPFYGNIFLCQELQEPKASAEYTM